VPDGIELNFGCPHGSGPTRHGSAVGQVPEYIEMVTRWSKCTRGMRIVKLTPEHTNVLIPPRPRTCGRIAGDLNQPMQLYHLGRSGTCFRGPTDIDGKATHGGIASGV